MGAPGRPARRLSAALAAFLLLTLAAALAPQGAQAQQVLPCPGLPKPVISVTGGVSSLTVTWGALSQNQDSVAGWQLEYRKTGASSWTTITISDAAARSRTITGLDAGAAYQVRLWAKHVRFTCPPGRSSTIATGTPDDDPPAPAAPTGFTATAGDGQVVLSWTDPDDDSITGYKLRYAKTGGRSSATWATISGSDADTTTYTVTSLENDAEYSFKVRAVNATGDGTATDWATATPMAPAAGVTVSESALTVAEGSTGTYTVVLDGAPTGTVTVTPSSSDAAAASVSPASLSFTTSNWNTAQTVTVTGEQDTDVRNETVTVSHAVSGGGASYASVTAASVTVTVTDDENPAAPVLAVPTVTGSKAVTLAWTHAGTAAGDLVKGAVSFSNWRLRSRLKGRTTWGTDTLSSNVAARSAAVPQGALGYPDGAVLEFQVAAVAFVSARPTIGPWSNIREITSRNDDLAALTITGSPVTVTAGSTATYTVALTQAEAGTLSISSADTGTATVQPASLTFTRSNYNTAQTVTVTGVEAGTTTLGHAFRLTGAGADAVPDAGTVNVTVNAPLPARPANFAAAPGDAQVTLSWDDPDDDSITGYELRYAKTGQRNSATWAAISGAGADTTSHTVTGLENHAGYSFKVRAVNATGDGTATAWATATPTDGVPKPTLTATAGDGRVTLSWPARSGMLNWGWQVKSGAGNNWSATRTVAGASTSTVVGEQANGVALTNGTEYTFRLFGLTPEGKQSVWSDWVTATPVLGTRGVTVSTTALTVAEGASGRYTVVLDATPSGTVTVTVGGASGDVTVQPASLTFTASNWRRAQPVTVRAGRDEDTATDPAVTLTHGAAGGGYGSVTIAPVTVSVTDTTPTLQLLTDPQAVREGEAIGLVVTSDRAVAGTLPVRLTLADRGSSGFAEADLEGSLGPRTFDAAFGGGTTATVRIATSRDFATDEGPETYRITLGDAAGYAVGADVTADGTLNDGPPPSTGGGGSLNRPPVARAGADFEAGPGAAAVLDGSASSDPDGDPLTYVWRQVSGPEVSLQNPASVRASFRAPAESGVLVFRLRVTEPVGRSDTDEVTVTVGDEAPVFAAAVPALDLVAGEAMAAVTLPAATGGNGALTYILTSAPADLAGLAFDPATRRLSGTPPAEGSWTFTWRADDADANRTAADAAILTFAVTVADARTVLMKRTVRRTLAAVARRALTGALDNLGARLAAEMPPGGLTLAGETVPLGVSGLASDTPALAGRACAAGEPWRHSLGQAGFGPGTPDCGFASRSVGSDDLLRTSAFSLALGAAAGEAGHDPQAPRWAVWGRGDYGTFAGRPDGMRYDGETRTGWLGIDARAGAWVAGLAVSRGAGEADYGIDGGEEGRLETELTAVYPYGRWTVSEGLELRGVFGAGWGEAHHRPAGAAAETGDLTMRMASLGLRHDLPPVAGIDLAARADAGAARLETDTGPAPVHGLTADSWRLRAGLEASRRIALDAAASLTPFVAAAARRDGGDGLSGTGLEIAGGVRWEAPRVQVEARGRWLAAHTEDGAEERGVSVTARVGPGAQGRGLSLLLHPRWGAGTGGAEALWRGEMPAAAAADGAANDAAALDARLGYGLGLLPWGLVTPFAETGLAGDDRRRLRLGTRFEAQHTEMAVELAGEHREGDAAGPEQAVRLDLRLRF